MTMLLLLTKTGLKTMFDMNLTLIFSVMYMGRLRLKFCHNIAVIRDDNCVDQGL